MANQTENPVVSEEREFLSPSGRFKLSTKEVGSVVKITESVVVRVEDGKEIKKFSLNSCYFNYSWATKNGQEYLSTSYYSSSHRCTHAVILNLDTGCTMDHTGNHWARVWFSPDGNTLAVLGDSCYWDDVHVYIFCDFTDPEQEYRELKLDHPFDITSKKEAEWDADGNFRIYETKEYIRYNGRLIESFSEEGGKLVQTHRDIPDSDYFDLVQKIYVLRRTGDEMIMVDTITPEITL